MLIELIQVKLGTGETIFGVRIDKNDRCQMTSEYGMAKELYDSWTSGIEKNPNIKVLEKKKI